MMDTSCSMQHNFMMHQKDETRVGAYIIIIASFSILCDLAWHGFHWCVKIIIVTDSNYCHQL